MSSLCHTLVTGTLWSLKGENFSDFTIEETPRAAIAIDNKGVILETGASSLLEKKYQPKTVHSFSDHILLPGFIDTHIHFPQILQVGKFGETLLGWLEKYIYPEEIRLCKEKLVRELAPLFFKELMNHGTTQALILSNSSFETTDTLFKEAGKIAFPATIGKVSMDRLAPKTLLVPPSKDKEESEELIDKWHKKSRLRYAITPRFAPACSKKLLTNLGHLSEKHSDLIIQTHFAENREELDLVKKMFPRNKDYLETYEDFGLITNKTVLAHGIYASPSEIRRIAKKGVTTSHCPTANLFLGSGLFPFEKYEGNRAPISIGTDIGAGTEFSIWKTLASAYSLQKLQGYNLTPGQLFYLATRAGAGALGISSQTGEIKKGMFADLQVINWKKVERLKYQMENTKTANERFFSLLFHFTPQILEALYISGKNRLSPT